MWIAAVLFFDPRNRLQVLTPKNTAPFVDIRSVPTLNQVISPRFVFPHLYYNVVI